MSRSKFKECQQLKEIFKQLIVDIGLCELHTGNPVVESIAEIDVGPEDKYSAFNFAEMLTENYLRNKQALIRCLQLLSAYGVDLLRPECDRASDWRTVLVSPEIGCIRGSVTVLTSLGYCTRSKNSYIFPSSTEPNEHTVREITVELIISQKELTIIPPPHRIIKYISDKANETALKEAAALSPAKSSRVSAPVSAGASRLGQLERQLAGTSKMAETNYSVPVQQSNLPSVMLKMQTFPSEIKTTTVVNIHENSKQHLPHSSSEMSPAQTNLRVPISEDVENQLNCDNCGSAVATTVCSDCNKYLCQECDVRWHGHFKRKNHSRQALVIPEDLSASSGVNYRDDSNKLITTISTQSPQNTMNLDASQTISNNKIQQESSDQAEINKLLALAMHPPASSAASLLPVKIPVPTGYETSASVKVSTVNSNVPLIPPVLNTSQYTPIGAASETSVILTADPIFNLESSKRYKFDEFGSGRLEDRITSAPAETSRREQMIPIGRERAVSASLRTASCGGRSSSTAVESGYKSKVVQMQEEAHNRIIEEQKLRLEQGTPQQRAQPESHDELKHESPLSRQLAETTHDPPKNPTVPSLPSVDPSRLNMYNGVPVEQTLELLHRKKEEAKRKNTSRAILRALKMAEAKGYNLAIRTILRQCQNSIDPVAYISDVWPKKVKDVIELSRRRINFDSECNPDVLTNICLEESNGDVQNAVELLASKWNEKVENLMKYCNMPPSDENRHLVTRELSSCDGDDDKALTELLKKKFLQNIYAHPPSEPSSTGDVNEIRSHLNEQLTEILKDESQDRERRARMILCEAHLQGWQRAENVLTLLQETDGAQLVDVVEAVQSQGTIDRCRQFLKRECECAICYSMYPVTQMRSLPACQCRVCVDCLRGHFEVVIRERFVRNLVCPVCSQPDIDSSEQTDAYFEILLIMLRGVLPDDVYDLFQVKLRDWNLMMDVSFRWCAYPNCRFGFIVGDTDQKKVVCPSCKKAMCQHCKKVWESQHEGLSCVDFQAWKEANDPELQAMGLARHLEENGIECPHCKCRYSLAKGGCMHFTCYQCRHEFCSGCLEDFKRGKTCKKFKSCAKAGLHCHHPRDCLFYLRDRDVQELQKLLNDRQVPFDSQVTMETTQPGLCTVMEQKQTQNGFKDEPCGKAVTEFSAGLCDVHHREYLVGLINRHSIDPAEVMVESELVLLLEKSEKQVPHRAKNKSDVEYRKQLLQCVIKELPLPDRSRRNLPAPRPAAAASRQLVTVEK